MAENQKYLVAGICAIALLLVFTVFASLGSLENAGRSKSTAELTLAIPSDGSGTEVFSTSIEEGLLFSGETVEVTFSTKDGQDTVKLNCSINCDRGID